MSVLIPFLALVLAGMAAAFFRVSLKNWVVITVIALAIGVPLGGSLWASAIAALLFAAVAGPLLHTPTRRQRLTAPLLKMYTKMLPQLSDTERTALEAGFTRFDTAPHYGLGLSERRLGDALRECGADMSTTRVYTKVGRVMKMKLTGESSESAPGASSNTGMHPSSPHQVTRDS